MSAVRSARDALTFVLGDRRVLLLATAIYVGVGLVFIHTAFTLNDEGLLTYDAARWARANFSPVFFFQKMKPVLAVLYLPLGGGGIKPFLVAHLLVAAVAIPIMAEAARALGFALPNLPALIVAFSPDYFFSGAAGISNSDGVVGVTLAIYLLVKRRELLAGVVLGMLPWVRTELVFLSAILVVSGLLWGQRRVALLMGCLCFSVPYLVIGAVYHHDLIWMIHYPPQGNHPMPNNPIWVSVSLPMALGNMVAVTPLAFLAFSFRYKDLHLVERALLIFTVFWLLVGTIFPIWRLANFGFLPRYALAMLPAIALLVGRTVEGWWGGRGLDRRAVIFPGVLALLWAITKFDQILVFAPIVVVGVVLLVLVRRLQIEAAISVATLLLLTGPLLPVDTQIPRGMHGYVPSLARWLIDHPSEVRGPIFTNSPLLAPYLAGLKDAPHLDVRFLIGADIAYELTTLGDHSNGQMETIRRLISTDFDGAPSVFPDALSPSVVPDGALFALRPHDRRIEMLLPPVIWAKHLRPVTEQDGRILRFVRAD